MERVRRSQKNIDDRITALAQCLRNNFPFVELPSVILTSATSDADADELEEKLLKVQEMLTGFQEALRTNFPNNNWSIPPAVSLLDGTKSTVVKLKPEEPAVGGTAVSLLDGTKSTLDGTNSTVVDLSKVTGPSTQNLNKPRPNLFGPQTQQKIFESASASHTVTGPSTQNLIKPRPNLFGPQTQQNASASHTVTGPSRVANLIEILKTNSSKKSDDKPPAFTYTRLYQDSIKRVREESGEKKEGKKDKKDKGPGCFLVRSRTE